MSFKQIIQPAFEKGHVFMHVIEHELNFKPFLAGNQNYPEYQYYKKNIFNDFISVLNCEPGSEHDFTMDGKPLRRVLSDNNGYFGLPVTAIKSGLNVGSYSDLINGVSNNVGFLFSSVKADTKLIYLSATDIYSKTLATNDGKIIIGINDYGMFPQLHEKQNNLLNFEKKIDVDLRVNNIAVIPQGKIINQPLSIVDEFWRLVDEKGGRQYLREIKELTNATWNESIIQTKLSDVLAVFTTDKSAASILNAAALAGMISDKLGLNSAIPVVLYRSGKLEQIEIDRDLVKTSAIKTAFAHMNKLDANAVKHFVSGYIKAVENTKTVEI